MRSLVRFGVFFTILAAVSALARPAEAQSVARPRSWSVSPFLGTSMGMGDPANDDSLGLGVTVGYDLTSNLGFEAELGHVFDVAGETDDIDWSLTNFHGNVLYHFDVRRFTPYATFGLGVERSSEDFKNPDVLALFVDHSATEVAFNFGGGVKYPINNRLLARADLRRFQANDQAPDYWRLYGGLTFSLAR